MLEHQLIIHCSPTLAGIKTANLFNYNFTYISDLMFQLRTVNKKLNSKGVYIEVLRIQESKALIFTYRPKNMALDLNKDGVAEFLEKYGYTYTSVEYALLKLKERISCMCDFPHEIGLFLGYPLDDVVGFISNKGKNCKCVGCWKVYGNECKTLKLFEQYKKCTNVYSKLFANGYSIMQLIVA